MNIRSPWIDSEYSVHSLLCKIRPILLLRLVMWNPTDGNEARIRAPRMHWNESEKVMQLNARSIPRRLESMLVYLQIMYLYTKC